MTTLSQLYELQELDTEISGFATEATSIVSQLGNRSVLDAQYEAIEVQKALLDQTLIQQKDQESCAGEMREKVRLVESKLYDGTVTNLKEMESSQHEVEFLRGQMKEMEDGLLETLVILEEIQEQLGVMGNNIQAAEDNWGLGQEELSKDHKRVEKTIAKLKARRQDLVAQVNPQEVTLYERLRVSKGGIAIAKVERGLCRGCRMALPTHQLQRARAGREPVLCNSCGRILYVS